MKQIICHRILQFILLLLALLLIVHANKVGDIRAMFLGLVCLIFDCFYYSSTSYFISKNK